MWVFCYRRATCCNPTLPLHHFFCLFHLEGHHPRLVQIFLLLAPLQRRCLQLAQLALLLDAQISHAAAVFILQVALLFVVAQLLLLSPLFPMQLKSGGLFRLHFLAFQPMSKHLLLVRKSHVLSFPTLFFFSLKFLSIPLQLLLMLNFLSSELLPMYFVLQPRLIIGIFLGATYFLFALPILTKSPRHIQSKYMRLSNVAGPLFSKGDSICRDQLSSGLSRFQQGLVQKIRTSVLTIAALDLNISSLMSETDTARTGHVSAFTGLFQRVVVARPFDRPVILIPIQTRDNTTDDRG